MINGIDALLLRLHTGSSTERAEVAAQLVQYTPKVVIKAVVDKILKDDEPERRSLITPLVEGLRSSSIFQRQLSINGLLQIGHLCIPYLDEVLLLDPASSLLGRVREEIKTLDDAFVEPQIRSAENVSLNVLPLDLSDKMIRTTKLSVTMGSEAGDNIYATDERLLAFMEINVDAWRNARREILQLRQAATKFLIAALEDIDVQTRRVAVKLLSILGDELAAIDLVNTINDNDVFVRDQAALALKKFDDAKVATHLVEAYTPGRAPLAGEMWGERT